MRGDYFGKQRWSRSELNDAIDDFAEALGLSYLPRTHQVVGRLDQRLLPSDQMSPALPCDCSETMALLLDHLGLELKPGPTLVSKAPVAKPKRGRRA